MLASLTEGSWGRRATIARSASSRTVSPTNVAIWNQTGRATDFHLGVRARARGAPRRGGDGSAGGGPPGRGRNGSADGAGRPRVGAVMAGKRRGLITSSVIRGDVIRGDVIRADLIRGNLIRGDVIRGDVIKGNAPPALEQARDGGHDQRREDHRQG